jgi:alginate O-acetyltransferase complex protein AlgI
LVVIYLITPARLRNLILLIASLIFYYWGSGYLVALLLYSIAVNYFFGIGIARFKEEKVRAPLLVCALITNLGLLFFFKYINFIVAELNNFFELLDIPLIQQTDILLPIGISFFTFQALSYIIDLYAGRVQVQNNPVNFALYISMFPQLVAGPIVRYIHISDQIKKRILSIDMFFSGLSRFVIGLFKKLVIADQLGGIVDKIINQNLSDLSAGTAWIGMICFAFQIYYDFSGYSDMAIGLGRIFGFRFLENFNYPYISKSVTEFWRRWHISLSTWFRDYLYIPLGGNRVSRWRNYFNLIVVFILCGIWHGAYWNFLIWGLFHGFFLILERTFLKKWLDKVPSFLSHIYFIIVICISWVFFRIQDFGEAVLFLKNMLFFNFNSPTVHFSEFLNPELYVYLILAIIFSMPVIDFIKRNYFVLRLSSRFPLVPELAKSATVLLLLVYSILMLASSSYKPFIYFKF